MSPNLSFLNPYAVGGLAGFEGLRPPKNRPFVRPERRCRSGRRNRHICRSSPSKPSNCANPSLINEK